MLTRQEWWTAVGLTAAMFAAVALIGACSPAVAQESAPYTMTSSDPLVIDRAEGAPAGMVAFLEDVQPHTFGRTNGTRAGFDFHCTSDGGRD